MEKFKFGCKEFRETGKCICNLYDEDGQFTKHSYKVLDVLNTKTNGYCPCRAHKSDDTICKEYQLMIDKLDIPFEPKKKSR